MMFIKFYLLIYSEKKLKLDSGEKNTLIKAMCLLSLPSYYNWSFVFACSASSRPFTVLGTPYHTIIYHQFVRMRVRKEPHWQGSSVEEFVKGGEVRSAISILMFLGDMLRHSLLYTSNLRTLDTNETP